MDIAQALSDRQTAAAAVARVRYWNHVVAAATGSGQPTPKDLVTLDTDLHTLGLTPVDLTADVEALREVHRIRDPARVAAVQQRIDAAHERHREAVGRVEVARAELARLDSLRGDAAIAAQVAFDAQDSVAQDRRRADQIEQELAARGFAVEPKPMPTVRRVRATKSCFVNNRLWQPGDVFDYGGPLGVAMELLDGDDAASAKEARSVDKHGMLNLGMAYDGGGTTQRPKEG